MVARGMYHFLVRRLDLFISMKHGLDGEILGIHPRVISFRLLTRSIFATWHIVKIDMINIVRACHRIP